MQVSVVIFVIHVWIVGWAYSLAISSSRTPSLLWFPSAKIQKGIQKQENLLTNLSIALYTKSSR
jgi:hypothetical protein